MTRIIWDARSHTLYPIGSEGGLTSGTVMMIRQIAMGLAERGHVVHVVTADLDSEEQRGPNLWYWGPKAFPTKADVVVMTMQVDPQTPFEADKLVLATFGVDPELGPNHQFASGVDAFPLLSETHGRLLREARPTIPVDKCFVTGLGVDLGDYGAGYDKVDKATPGGYLGDHITFLHPKTPTPKVPGRMLYANDPARGLFYLLDIFDLVKKEVPEASLHVTYDFDRNLEVVKWGHHYMAQMLLDCKRRIETTPGVVNRGKLTRAEIIREQLECQVHCMPSDPPAHDQIHGLTQLECAAAGAALVFSDIDAFPEVLGEGATILPVIGKYLPEIERRVDAKDYAAIVVELMKDPEKWREASYKARALAEKHTWAACVDKWEGMLAAIMEGVAVG